MTKLTSAQLAWKIRRHALEMTHLSKGAHLGAVLSVADIVAVLYADVLKYNPCNPLWNERDRFILSKGHAGAAVYAALAEEGFFDTAELKTHYQNGSRLSGHVLHFVSGVECSTGSLGHGLSIAAGMAYALKKDKKQSRVFAVIGDGECDEGAVWEAALFANHFRLNNLAVVIDHNHMQSLDFCENTIELEDLGAKWRAFGWNVIETNGNDCEALKKAFQNINTACASNRKPTVIVADTIKGFGIPFMQHDILWHYRFPHTGWDYDCAVEALHKTMPNGITDPYTPNGIKNPIQPGVNDEINIDHTFSKTWQPSYPEVMRRVEALPGSSEAVHKIKETQK